MSTQNPEFDLPTPEELADLLPGYSEVEFYAQGGMAAIYKGLQTSLERQVAIKVLPREYGTDEAFRLRFKAEGKAMAKLNHPNLVSIFDFGEIDGLLYIVMEFVAGETLYQHAYGTALPQLEAVKFARQVADGLAHAHGLGILHRDIKPANVLLNEKGVPKLGDFGLAEGEERAEGDDLAFGTPGYTPPEVMADPTSADEKADIFAVGVMLYELLTTQLPEEDYQPPSRLVKGNFRTDAVIQKAIQPKPALRYASAAELAKALKTLEGQLKNNSNAGFASVDSGAAAPEVTSTSTSPARATQKVGPDFKLFRNLIIIAGLVLAILVAHTALKKRQGEVSDEQAEIDQAKALEERKQEAQRIAFEKLSKRLQEENEAALLAEKEKADTVDAQPEPEPEEESLPTPDPVVKVAPALQLERLRIALKEGDLSAFPSSSLERAGSQFFYVEEPMTWHQALVFAENHGAHLAIPPTPSDLRWLGQQLPAGVEDFWLGGGAVARSDWAWLDAGIEFSFKKPALAMGTAAKGTNFGILKAAQPKERLPFFIQWRTDGSNPADLENRMRTLSATLSQTTPKWPAGTLSMDDARYLIVAREFTFAEAEAFAKDKGGILAVASSELEAAFFRDSFANTGLDSAWIGGRKEGDDWSWISGEPWSFARWGDTFPVADPNMTALALTAEGWVNRAPTTKAASILIEWSDSEDAIAVAPQEGSEGVTAVTEEVQELQTLARKLLATELADHVTKMKRNTKSQGSFMRSWFRNLAQSDVVTYKASFELYTAQINPATGRLPSPEAIPAGTLPLKAMEIVERHYKLQQGYDFELEAACEKIRVAYVARIETKANELEEKGLKAKVASLQEEIEGVGTTGKEFLAHFQFMPFGEIVEEPEGLLPPETVIEPTGVLPVAPNGG